MGDSVMLGGAPTATGGTSPYTYNWTPSLAGANPAVMPTSPTTYLLSLTDANNCSSTDTVMVSVDAVPSAGFSFTTTLLTANFTDMSTGSISGYGWDFGDGGSSILASPGHTYAADGVYQVCLSVYSPAGCVSTTCDSVTVIGLGQTGPMTFAKFTIAPNPWTQSAMINFDLLASSAVQLEVFDLQGRRLAVLQDGNMGAGAHTFELKDTQMGGTSGTHLVKLTVNGKSTSQTIVHLR
jgi:hypothetical protein